MKNKDEKTGKNAGRFGLPASSEQRSSYPDGCLRDCYHPVVRQGEWVVLFKQEMHST